MEATLDYKQLYEEQVRHSEALQVQLAGLTHQLKELQRLIFGSRHERFTPDHHNPSRLPLGIEADPVAVCNVVDAKRISYTRTTTDTEPKGHPVRMKLPDHLERREVTIEPSVDVTGLRRLSEEITLENWTMNQVNYLCAGSSGPNT
jgi:hypothetical protein